MWKNGNPQRNRLTEVIPICWETLCTHYLHLMTCMHVPVLYWFVLVYKPFKQKKQVEFRWLKTYSAGSSFLRSGIFWPRCNVLLQSHGFVSCTCVFTICIGSQHRWSWFTENHRRSLGWKQLKWYRIGHEWWFKNKNSRILFSELERSGKSSVLHSVTNTTDTFVWNVIFSLNWDSDVLLYSRQIRKGFSTLINSMHEI